MTDGEAIFSGRGVIAEAVKENGVGEAAYFSAGGFREGDAEVFGGVIDAKEIARELAVRRNNHNPAGMCEHLEFGVPDISESDGLGEGVNGWLLAGEEMPTGFGAGAVVL